MKSTMLSYTVEYRSGVVCVEAGTHNVQWGELQLMMAVPYRAATSGYKNCVVAICGYGWVCVHDPSYCVIFLYTPYRCLSLPVFFSPLLVLCYLFFFVFCSFFCFCMSSSRCSPPSTLGRRSLQHAGWDSGEERSALLRRTGALTARPGSAPSVYTGTAVGDGIQYMVCHSLDWSLRTNVANHLLIRRDAARFKRTWDVFVKVVTTWRVTPPVAYKMDLTYTRFAREDTYSARLDNLDVYVFVEEDGRVVNSRLIVLQRPLLDCARTSTPYAQRRPEDSRQWVVTLAEDEFESKM